MKESIERFRKLVGKKIAHDNGPFTVMLFFCGLKPFFMVKNKDHEISFVEALEYMVIE